MICREHLRPEGPRSFRLGGRGWRPRGPASPSRNQPLLEAACGKAKASKQVPLLLPLITSPVLTNKQLVGCGGGDLRSVALRNCRIMTKPKNALEEKLKTVQSIRGEYVP